MALILVTVMEAAEHFDVHRATLYRWIKDGRLDTVVVKGKTYLMYGQIDAQVEQRR
jgi:excisionase family DNA binding protein